MAKGQIHERLHGALHRGGAKVTEEELAEITAAVLLIVGEITTDCYVDMPRVVRNTIRDAGYTRARFGIDWETCGVLVSVDEQSPDIARGVNIGSLTRSVFVALILVPALIVVFSPAARRMIRRN